MNLDLPATRGGTLEELSGSMKRAKRLIMENRNDID
jgi:hypothetical protein